MATITDLATPAASMSARVSPIFGRLPPKMRRYPWRMDSGMDMMASSVQSWAWVSMISIASS